MSCSTRRSFQTPGCWFARHAELRFLVAELEGKSMGRFDDRFHDPWHSGLGQKDRRECHADAGLFIGKLI